MAKTPEEMTVAQLERELEKKRSKLQLLNAKRQQLQRELNKVDTQIAELSGRTVSASDSGAAAETGGVRRRRRRPKNSQSLRAHVVDLLTRNKKGLTISELDEKIQASGYKSKSKNFKNVLYQCLYNTEEIGQDKASGRYMLKS